MDEVFTTQSRAIWFSDLWGWERALPLHGWSISCCQQLFFGSKSLLEKNFRHVSHSASPKWWQCCGLREQYLRTMRNSAFGEGNDIHSGFCRWLSYSPSPIWWQCKDFRQQFSRTMWVYTFIHESHSLHTSWCRDSSHCASPKWRLGSSLWKQSPWTMRYSSFGWWIFLYPGCCWGVAYSTSSKWWQGCSLRGKIW